MLSVLFKLADHVGAHRAPNLDAHERDRARQRVMIAAVFGLAAAWAAFDASRAGPVPALLLLVPILSVGYALTALVHLRWLLPRRGVTLGGQYSFIVLDSVLTVTSLVGAPSVLAPFYPVLMVQIVRCGMRYGLRTLWLAWAAAVLAAAVLMPFSSFWTTEVGLLRSFMVMMVIIPVLFGPLVQSLHRITDELRGAAGTDPHTGLANRRSLFEQLRLARARNAREGTMLAVMLFDLDHFKAVNDTLGHAVGDRLLAVVADTLRSHARPGELVARLGGDEFVVLAEGLPVIAGVAQARDRAVQLVARIEAAAQPLAPGLGVSASAGVHCWAVGAQAPRADATPAVDRDVDSDLLAQADRAMYESKRAGKGRVAVTAPQRVGSSLPPSPPTAPAVPAVAVEAVGREAGLPH